MRILACRQMISILKDQTQFKNTINSKNSMLFMTHLHRSLFIWSKNSSNLLLILIISKIQKMSKSTTARIFSNLNIKKMNSISMVLIKTVVCFKNK